MHMRTWNNKLYFSAMPGRTKYARPTYEVSEWLSEMQANDIHTVVCLAPERDIQAESSAYAGWRQARGQDPAGFKLIDFPIVDFGIPEQDRIPAFRALARDLADRVEQGEKVYIHCGAGIGRTGTLAVAILMALGYEYKKAYDEIYAAGSHPETPAQRQFLESRAGM